MLCCQVVVSSYEAAVSIIIEFDMDNSIFGLPREFVVASAGEHVWIHIIFLVLYFSGVSDSHTHTEDIIESPTDV